MTQKSRCNECGWMGYEIFEQRFTPSCPKCHSTKLTHYDTTYFETLNKDELTNIIILLQIDVERLRRELDEKIGVIR